jgi:hypothetical protein
MASRLLKMLEGLQVLIEELVEVERPKPWPVMPASPPTPMADHDFHWVVDRYGGSPQVCCPWHEERMFQGSAPATERLIDQLGGEQRRYIHERMGGNPRDFPGPRR